MQTDSRPGRADIWLLFALGAIAVWQRLGWKRNFRASPPPRFESVGERAGRVRVGGGAGGECSISTRALQHRFADFGVAESHPCKVRKGGPPAQMAALNEAMLFHEALHGDYGFQDPDLESHFDETSDPGITYYLENNVLGSHLTYLHDVPQDPEPMQCPNTN